VSRSAGCQYCVAHSANLAASRAIPTRKVRQVWQYETSSEFNAAERAALRFAQARAGAEVRAAISYDSSAILMDFAKPAPYPISTAGLHLG
jgi:alkylhydroperoxidase family enzyme